MDLTNFKKAKTIFVIGIGGSDLASKAVWNAMSLHRNLGKKLFFLESPDEREYEEIKNLIQASSLDELAVVAISKSGTTVETLTAFENLFNVLHQKFGEDTQKKIIVISTKDTELWQRAEGSVRIEWEGDIGGRWSAFTAPHRVVLELAGLNVDSFKKAQSIDVKDEAQGLANKIHESYNKGANILDFFIFNSELEDLGKWCRQLIAESLGKTNDDGVEVGLVPTVSIGPTDLHSMLQLALGGPKNRFTVFVRSLAEIDETINEKSFGDTVTAYEREGLPFYKYEMSEISEMEIGKFMSLMMSTTLALAALLKVNPLDQPAVENYKSHLHNS